MGGTVRDRTSKQRRGTPESEESLPSSVWRESGKTVSRFLLLVEGGGSPGKDVTDDYDPGPCVSRRIVTRLKLPTRKTEERSGVEEIATLVVEGQKGEVEGSKTR